MLRVGEHLGHRDGVLIVDEIGFVKKGTRSAGVQRQYSGTAGRVENCQLGVSLAYASPAGRALIDRELYLPRTGIGDQRCREDAGVPAEVQFATKSQLGQAMHSRALDAGMPARWMAADEAYGQDSKSRAFCDQRRVGYVVVPQASAWGSRCSGWGPLGEQKVSAVGRPTCCQRASHSRRTVDDAEPGVLATIVPSVRITAADVAVP
ncbi:hypothetical protein Acy02nite_91650 [Actinoplanes cyaneus]|uniref:Transposase IS701-like DDE domain-containing protein n=1 Tax=Actinoplanes cyaneus TaxID=52696 RepID=A0A919MD33_9ACTN|nr:hypothetical protein Acy02nite_91650 [Actinoplanes cyaneus]